MVDWYFILVDYKSLYTDFIYRWAVGLISIVCVHQIQPTEQQASSKSTGQDGRVVVGRKLPLQAQIFSGYRTLVLYSAGRYFSGQVGLRRGCNSMEESFLL